MEQDTEVTPPKKSFWLSLSGMSCIAVFSVIAIVLIIDHRQHLYSYLPYLFLLLCPLLHVFMHHGHNHRNPSGKGE